MAAPTVSRTPSVHRAHRSLTQSADGRLTTAWFGSGEPGHRSRRRISIFSFARRALLCLAAAPVKAQDELAALGLDCGPASHLSPDIRAKNQQPRMPVRMLEQISN